MSMGSRKVNTEGIDEELLIASIGRRKQDGTLYRAQEPPVPAPEEESVPETEPPPTASPSREKVQKDIARRKRQEDDYSGLFLRRHGADFCFSDSFPDSYPLYIIYSLYFCINIQHQSVE